MKFKTEQVDSEWSYLTVLPSSALIKISHTDLDNVLSATLNLITHPSPGRVSGMNIHTP